MIATPTRRTLAILVAIATLGACSNGGGGGSAGKTKRVDTADSTQSRAGDGPIDLGGANYTVTALASVGSVSGTISLSGGARHDTIPVTTDVSVCGTSVDGPVQASATGLSDAVVWIADVTTGKALPVDRRKDLASEDCMLDPRVQAVVVRTTVNVTNADKLLHRLIFTRIGTHDTLTVMPFFNQGQVVPSERLARRSGIVEVTCLQHSFTRAYIAVFYHPYFAVTGNDGSFTIDSLPPGSYQLMVWHEGTTKAVARPVRVIADSAVKVNVALTIQ